MLAVGFLCPQTATGWEARLEWDPTNNPDLQGYWLFYGRAPRQYTTVIDVRNVTNYQVKNLFPGTYYFSLKAYGSYENESPFSQEIAAFFPAESATPPQISGIAFSNVTETSVTVSWSTDKLSDSAVEYWSPEDPSTAEAALSTFETEHRLTLNNLRGQTRYEIRVSSTDLSGQQSTISGLSFTTTHNAFSLAWPLFLSVEDLFSAESFSGTAFINLGSEFATVRMTVTGENGIPETMPDLSNPVIRELSPQSQLAILDWELFGGGFSKQRPNGWIKVEGGRETRGFFQVLDRGVMDGANLQSDRLTDIALTEIQAIGHNKIHLSNNNAQDAMVTVDLVNRDGFVRASRSRVMKSNGALVEDLFTGLFNGMQPSAADWVRVRSNMPLHSFQVIGHTGGDIAMLAGQDLTTGATTLYSPQYVVGGNYRTSLSIINLDSVAGEVVLSLMGDSGISIGQIRTAAIPPSGKIYIDDPEFFRSNDPGSMITGYVQISSRGIRLAGSVVFEDVNRRSFSTALALLSKLRNTAVFSHVASDETYFTGLAVLNPNKAGATAAIRLYAEDGTLIDETRRWIGAGFRESLLMTQWFPALQGRNQSSGFFKLSSDIPLVSFALFGTNDLSALSAIPQQSE